MRELTFENDPDRLLLLHLGVLEVDQFPDLGPLLGTQGISQFGSHYQFKNNHLFLFLQQSLSKRLVFVHLLLSIHHLAFEQSFEVLCIGRRPLLLALISVLFDRRVYFIDDLVDLFQFFFKGGVDFSDSEALHDKLEAVFVVLLLQKPFGQD